MNILGFVNSEPLLIRLEETLQGTLAREAVFDSVHTKARTVSAHLCLSGKARRFRPLLVDRLGKAVGVSEAALLPLACAAELIHAASLLHDDVVDDSPVRRGKPTANALYGNAVAVLSGDWLLTQAFLHLRNLPMDITWAALETVSQMSSAAILEVSARKKVMPLEGWWNMARGKTGALFSFCGKGVGLAAANTDAQEAFSKLGWHLGVAFQLGDDLKDFVDLDSGKPRLQDVALGNPSSVLSVAAQTSSSLKAKLEAAWASEQPFDVEALSTEILETGALDEVLRLLRQEVDASLECVSKFDPQGKLEALFRELAPKGTWS